jgi:hypothetical protein
MNKKDLQHFKEKLEKEKVLLEEELGSISRINPDNPSDWEATTSDIEVDAADENEVADKMEELKKAHLSLISFIQNHKTESTVSQPKIKFYSGILGIKQAFRDMPWVKEHTESFLFWPVRDMIDNIGEEFFKWHGVQRFKHQVFLYCIEKHTDRKLQQNLNKEWLHINKKNLVKARYLPKGTDVKMSYWIYGDKVLFASGGTEKIAFTVHSKEFSQLMKIMWQNTWDNSKE